MNEAMYHPGLEGIIAGETAISTVDGGLRYRGYAIEELAKQASFEETAYLIWHGELPNATQLGGLKQRMAEARVPQDVMHFLAVMPRNSNSMDVLRTGISALAHWDTETEDNQPEANLRKSERLLAQCAVLVAAWYRLRQEKLPLGPSPQRSLAGNLLYMLTGQEPTPRMVKAMDVSLILYAEHEFNASTFTARVVCSTLSDLHSGVTAAIGALKGPLHGGANEKVMEVLGDVGTPELAEAWVREALARKVRIMGFGHRVYKTGDPRAAYLKSLCAELAAETGHEDMEQMADIIETIVTREKQLPPNLDWPSARLYYYLGLPVEVYTPLFVASRIVGWTAHIMEQLANNRLIRPRSRYVGPEPKAWIELDRRS